MPESNIDSDGHYKPLYETLGTLLGAHMNPTQAEVGGWVGHVTRNRNGTITVTINNVTGMASFLGVSTKGSVRAAIFVDRLGGALGTPNITQRFTWSEDDPCPR